MLRTRSESRVSWLSTVPLQLILELNRFALDAIQNLSGRPNRNANGCIRRHLFWKIYICRRDGRGEFGPRVAKESQS
jgi:hypothetical protein